MIWNWAISEFGVLNNSKPHVKNEAILVNCPDLKGYRKLSTSAGLPTPNLGPIGNWAMQGADEHANLHLCMHRIRLHAQNHPLNTHKLLLLLPPLLSGHGPRKVGDHCFNGHLDFHNPDLVTILCSLSDYILQL